MIVHHIGFITRLVTNVVDLLYWEFCFSFCLLGLVAFLRCLAIQMVVNTEETMMITMSTIRIVIKLLTKDDLTIQSQVRPLDIINHRIKIIVERIKEDIVTVTHIEEMMGIIWAEHYFLTSLCLTAVD